MVSESGSKTILHNFKKLRMSSCEPRNFFLRCEKAGVIPPKIVTSLTPKEDDNIGFLGEHWMHLNTGRLNQLE
jgi:hypothetical protein